MSLQKGFCDNYFQCDLAKSPDQPCEVQEVESPPFLCKECKQPLKPCDSETGTTQPGTTGGGPGAGFESEGSSDPDWTERAVPNHTFYRSDFDESDTHEPERPNINFDETPPNDPKQPGSGRGLRWKVPLIILASAAVVGAIWYLLTRPPAEEELVFKDVPAIQQVVSGAEVRLPLRVTPVSDAAVRLQASPSWLSIAGAPGQLVLGGRVPDTGDSEYKASLEATHTGYASGHCTIRFEVKKKESAPPESVPRPTLDQTPHPTSPSPMPTITPSPMSAIELTGPTSIEGVVGRRLPEIALEVKNGQGSGLILRAENLPPGLTLQHDRITGTPSIAGRNTATVIAEAPSFKPGRYQIQFVFTDPVPARIVYKIVPPKEVPFGRPFPVAVQVVDSSDTPVEAYDNVIELQLTEREDPADAASSYDTAATSYLSAQSRRVKVQGGLATFTQVVIGKEFPKCRLVATAPHLPPGVSDYFRVSKVVPAAEIREEFPDIPKERKAALALPPSARRDRELQSIRDRLVLWKMSLDAAAENGTPEPELARAVKEAIENLDKPPTY